jgi:hypothetical protein
MRATHKLRVTIGLLTTLAAASGLAGAIAACSSSSNANGGDGGGTGGGGGCTNTNYLTLTFSPMYSAYEPSHTYQLPVIVNTDPATLTVSDTTAVQFQEDPELSVNGYHGWMLTMLKAPNGPITLTAQAGNACGSAQLFITSATPDDWQIGNARYNNGASLHFPMFGGGGDGGRPMGPPPMMTMDGSFFETADGGPACTSCHGETATSGFLNDVAHTPEQTGGFSDMDLINIIVHGQVPEGGYFDPNILSMPMWHMLHQWTDIQPDQYLGMVVYLRSLTPVAQMGHINLGGFMFGGPRDGGGGG